MWNITQPEASTAASGTQTETSARPASWSQTVGAAAGARSATQRARSRGSRAGDGERASGGSRVEPVADAPHRLEVRGVGRVGLELLAEPADVHGDRARCRARAGGPRRGPSGGSREKTRRGFEARNQSRSNSRAVSVTRLAGLRHLAARAVEHDVAELEPLGRGSVVAPARRSTVRTRAASSRGENGFVT